LAGLLSKQSKNCVQAWTRHTTGLSRKENCLYAYRTNAQIGGSL
jgi:hypothetical protein